MLLGFSLALSTSLYAQTGIGTDHPNKAAALDIQSDQRGLLIPRVELQEKDKWAPITADKTESLLVYNKTENSGFNKGFYYWFDGGWLKILTEEDLDEIGNGATTTEDEVWLHQDTGDPATENDAPLYHKGDVAIGKEENNNDEIVFQVDDNALVVRKDGWVGIGYDTPTDESTEYLGFKQQSDQFQQLITLLKNIAPLTLSKIRLNLGEIIGHIEDYEQIKKTPKEKLRVNGAITSLEFYYPDYVFQDYFDAPKQENSHQYEFQSLDQTKDYIEKHKHLPGITPAWALPYSKEEGYRFNLSRLSIKSLEKVEELYLHTIEQDEKINRLKKRITAAKTQKGPTKTAKKINQLKNDKRDRSKRINRLEQRIANLEKNK